MTLLRSGSATDVGRVRTSNQDVALEEPDLFAVADGMGGHVGGEVAARVAVDALRASFRKQPTVEGLRRAVAEANRDVWRKGQTESGLRGMGTTLTATALVRDPGGRQVIALANVGDSRAYVFSRGQVIQITADHSLAEERVRQGEMTEAEAQVHPQRHILTRALGVSSDVDVDLWELHLADGDRILLCSDGLTNEVDDEQIRRILSTTRDPQEAARSLVRAAVDHGGSDNVTVVVVDVVSAGETADASERDRSNQPMGGFAGDAAPTTAIPSLAGGAAGAQAAGASGDPAGSQGTEPAPAVGRRRNAGEAGEAGEAGDPGSSPATGVLRAITAGRRNSRASTRPAGADGAGSSGGNGHADPAGVTGLMMATRTGDRSHGGDGGPSPRPGAGVGAAGAGGTGAAAGGAGGGPVGRSAFAATSGGRPGAGTAAGLAGTAGGRRPPADFGSQAAELRRLRPTRRERRRRRRSAGVPRLVTVRVVLFVILLLAVVAAAYALVRWYAMDDWYVAVDHQHLVVYQGRPGGFLWFKPKLVDDTSVTTSEILPFHLPAVQANHQEPSLEAARRYIANLHQEYLATQPAAAGGTSASGSPTTTTTSPAGSG